MNLIVAVSSNWGIGYKNRLLFRIREDLLRFKELTTNKTVVMGHNTFKSLPGGKPLPNRENIVLSRQKNLQLPGATVCESLPALAKILKARPPEDIFIIGGENVYAQFLNYCRLAYITKVEATPPADVFMPNMDELSNWQIIEEKLPKNRGEFVHIYSIYTNTMYNRENFFVNFV